MGPGEQGAQVSRGPGEQGPREGAAQDRRLSPRKLLVVMMRGDGQHRAEFRRSNGQDLALGDLGFNRDWCENTPTFLA